MDCNGCNTTKLKKEFLDMADERPRRFYLARLTLAEHDLLRDLRFLCDGEVGRYDALLELTPFIESLTDDDFAEDMLVPIRLPIPTPIDKLLKKKSKELGKAYIRCLVRAAERFKEARRKEINGEVEEEG
jgi:hypothetical protein